jgi:hypothetical protein
VMLLVWWCCCRGGDDDEDRPRRPAPRPAAEAQAAAFIDQYNALHRPLSLMEMHQQVCLQPCPLYAA